MRIECPECKLSGNMDESAIPATGMTMNCPRCKAHFTVLRPETDSSSAGAMLDNCPSCQYATFSEEKFAVCPKCGLVVADYLRNKLDGRPMVGKKSSGRPQNTREEPLPTLTEEQLRKEEEARKRYGLDVLPEEQEKGGIRRFDFSEVPLPILIVGGVTVLAALGLLIYGFSGISYYNAKVAAAEVALKAGEPAPSGAALFIGFAFFPILKVIYSLAMMLFGVQFLLHRLWSINALEKGAWAGMAILGLTELADVVAWCRRASDSASFGYYATGVLGGLLAALLWIAPLFVLKEYLQSIEFGRLEERFR